MNKERKKERKKDRINSSGKRKKQIQVEYTMVENEERKRERR